MHHSLQVIAHKDNKTGCIREGRATSGQVSLNNPQSAQAVPLSDLAEVKLSDERESISRTNGQDAVDVQIVKTQGANTVAVANDVNQTIQDFVKAHPELKSVKIMDTSKPIKDSLNTMIEKSAPRIYRGSDCHHVVLKKCTYDSDFRLFRFHCLYSSQWWR